MPRSTFRTDDSDGGLQAVARFDLLDVRPRAVRTDEGFLEALATPIARTGVLEYRRPDGTVQRELRLPEEVFDAESIRTLSGKPVTDEHPPSGLAVTSETATFYSRGAVANPRRSDTDEGQLLADIHVHAQEAIDSIDAGRRELSAGYAMVPVPIPGGVFKRDGHPLNGTQADVLQTRIRYNHVAIVTAGRANDGTPDRPFRLRLDSAGNQVGPDRHHNRGARTVETIQIVINGRTYHVRADSADSFRANMQAEADERAAAVKRADEAEKARDEAVARADAAESERDELKSKVEETETKLTEAEKQRADASDPEKLAKERADHVALVLEVKELKGEAGKVEELVRLDSKALQVELATTLGIDDADKKEPAILAELIAFAKKNRIDAAGAGTQTVATQQTSASVIAQAITQAPAQRADAVKDSPFLSALKERDEARKQKASA